MFLAMAFFVAMPALAAKPAPEKKDVAVKIGVIDFQKIMRESRAAKSARDSFMKDVEVKRNTLLAKEKEVKLLDGELKKSMAQLSPEAKREKGERLAREGKELTRLRDDLAEELKKRNAELTGKMVAEIVGVARSLRQKENYSVILEKNSVVVFDEAIDVTDRIIKIFDENSGN
jgi:outer membrane protein